MLFFFFLSSSSSTSLLFLFTLPFSIFGLCLLAALYLSLARCVRVFISSHIEFCFLLSNYSHAQLPLLKYIFSSSFIFLFPNRTSSFSITIFCCFVDIQMGIIISLWRGNSLFLTVSLPSLPSFSLLSGYTKSSQFPITLSMDLFSHQFFIEQQQQQRRRRWRLRPQ